jgi:dethiobiotin synthetase
VVIGAWPAEPERVHRTNLSELRHLLAGAVPEGAGAMEPTRFHASASGWLTPRLYGTLDDRRDQGSGRQGSMFSSWSTTIGGGSA